MRRALLVIDFQMDFMDVAGATLPVTGAVKDVERVCHFIEKVNPTTIFSSLDSHYGLDISHPAWWTKADGSFVDAFTPISSTDIEKGIYVPRVDPVGSLKYVRDLEDNGEFGHFIWPEHCLIGTPGHNLHPLYMQALNEWSKHNLKWVNFINKGTNPYTEHFGIFRANVPMMKDSTTQINQAIFNTLETHDEVYLVGEARTHCVANSLRQLVQLAPQLTKKLIVLEDCMSNVGGLEPWFYDSVDAIYADAKSQGVTFIKSTDV